MKNKDQIKKQPTYSLQECKDAVAQGDYLLSHAANNFIADLDRYNNFSFSHKNFEHFVQNLTEKDFQKSIQYATGITHWLDVYKAPYDVPRDDGGKERIIFYFKFYLRDNTIHVRVVSFHEDR